MSRPRIAVVGAGIAGLGAAHRLAPHCDVTVFEADDRPGGHAHTVDITLPGAHGPVTHGVDTGFLVFNERTYPRLCALFAELGVAVAKSEMTFSVQAPRADGGRLEWSGTSLNTVFADRGNLLRPRFHGMLLDLLRFNRLATRLAKRGADAELAQPLDEFLAAHRFGTAFVDDYLLPMIGCIWSCSTVQMLRFPVGTLIRFCHNHGLLQVRERPQWFTVAGGSRRYVDQLATRVGRVRLAMPVLGVARDASRAPGASAGVRTRAGVEWFDEVVLAVHAPQALALLDDASADERRTLGAIGYQHNEAVLHTDERLLPRRRAAWAAWNYERDVVSGGSSRHVCLHYRVNQLQPLPWRQSVIVSLNPLHAPRPETVLRRIAYAHPVFDGAAIVAQGRLADLQGRSHTWFCGAWTGYGFHEDGLRSGQEVADGILARRPAGARSDAGGVALGEPA
ncbi:MAG TPA: FAD-dependent oxidoreductase [Burkholderiaceae bacterium]|nr:FAD-dependent oxidoreductase [Burkholderiaceae bacterium]